MPRNRLITARTRVESSKIDWSDPIAAGITNCWAFSERAGDTIQDLVRGNNAQTLNNGGAGAVPSWASGLEDPGCFSIQFDGTNGGSNRTAVGVPNPSSPHTMACLIYVMDSGSLSTMVGYGNDSTNTGHNFVVSAGNTMLIRRVSTGATVISFSYPTGLWRFVVYTFDGTTNTLYHNGIAVATSVTAPQSATVNAVTSGENVHTGFPERALNGTRLSSVTFWNRPLRAGEVFKMWDPPTRWNLFKPRKARVPFAATVAGTSKPIGAFVSRTKVIPGGLV